MSGTVTISISALEVLMQSASEWADELSCHIAPASRDFGDDESAESQEEQSRNIDDAFKLASELIAEAQKKG